MAICPNCKKELSGETVVREKVNNGELVRTSMTTAKNMEVYTTMFSCPNCQAVLGFAQYLGNITNPQKRDFSFI